MSGSCHFPSIDDPVPGPLIIEPHNPRMVVRYFQLAAKLQEQLAGVPLVSIHHVGSTAVPGLAARPIIDILVTVAHKDWLLALSTLINTGLYVNRGDQGFGRYIYVLGFFSPGFQVLSLCVSWDGSPFARSMIAVRKALRASQELRLEFEKVKHDARADYSRYNLAKERFFFEVLDFSTKKAFLSMDDLALIALGNPKVQRIKPFKTKRLLLRELTETDLVAICSQDQGNLLGQLQDIIRQSLLIPRSLFALAVTHRDKLIGHITALKNDPEFLGKNLISAPNEGSIHFKPAMAWILEMYHDLVVEALEAFIEVLKRHWGMPLTLSETAPRNATAYGRLLRRVGLRYSGTRRGGALLFRGHFASNHTPYSHRK